MSDIPDPKNSKIIGQKAYFNEKATFYGGVKVYWPDGTDAGAVKLYFTV